MMSSRTDRKVRREVIDADVLHSKDVESRCGKVQINIPYNFFNTPKSHYIVVHTYITPKRLSYLEEY
jgi:hypothetical protein